MSSNAHCVSVDALVDSLNLSRQGPPLRDTEQLLAELSTVVNSDDILEEWWWSLMQATLLAHALPTAARLDTIGAIMNKHTKESHLCIMEIWNELRAEAKSESERIFLISVCGLGLLKSTALPRGQAIDAISIYNNGIQQLCADHIQVASASRKSHGAESVQVSIDAHNEVLPAPQLLSWKEFDTAFPELVLHRQLVLKCLQSWMELKQQAHPPLFLDLCFSWLHTFAQVLCPAGGVTESSLDISLEEQLVIHGACEPIATLLVESGVTQLGLVDFLASRPAVRTETEQKWACGPSMLCLASIFFSHHGNPSKFMAAVYSPIFFSWLGLKYAAPLLDSSPKLGLWLVAQAILLSQSGSQQRFSMRDIDVDRANANILQGMGSLIADICEKIVEIAVKSPEPVVRSKLTANYLTPLLQVFMDSRGRFVLLSALVQRCPYSNAVGYLLQRLKEEFSEEYNMLFGEGSPRLQPIFTHRSAFDKILLPMLDVAHVEDRSEVVSAALNLLRFALIKDAKRKALFLWHEPARSEISTKYIVSLKQKLAFLVEQENRQSQAPQSAQKSILGLQAPGNAEAAIARGIASKQLLLSICVRVLELLEVA